MLVGGLEVLCKMIEMPGQKLQLKEQELVLCKTYLHVTSNLMPYVAAENSCHCEHRKIGQSGLLKCLVCLL